MKRLVLCLAILLQADEWKDRAKIETGPGRLKVTLDGSLLYDGAGTKAVVGSTKAAGRTFVTVTVDGEERVRLWASEISPVKVPDWKVGEAEALSLRTQPEEVDGVEQLTISIIPTVNGKAGAPVVVFRGKGGAPAMTTVRGVLEVTLDGACIYRGPRRRPDPVPAKVYTVADFVGRLNLHRRAAGVGEVKAKAELSRACDLHALYLVKNLRRPEASNLNAHKEEPGFPGYTPEGADAGAKSVIHFFGSKRDLTTSVDSLMATFYHRMKMISPKLEEVGAGWAFDPDGVAVVVIHVSAPGKGSAPDPVVYPGPDQKDVPVEFGGGGREVPDPVPDPRANAGYPITLQWEPSSWQPKGSTAKVTCDGKEVACWVSTPESPARADEPQPGWVCVIPREVLKPGKTYVVEFACTRSDDGKAYAKKWGFTSAK